MKGTVPDSFREMRKIKQKELWQNPEYREKMLSHRGIFKKGQTSWNSGLKVRTNTGRTHFKKGEKHTEEWKRQQSERVQKLLASGWRPPVMRGENHPAWANGGSPHKYVGHYWRTIRTKILDRDGWSCKRCNKLVSGKDACVDHIVPFRVSKSNDFSNLQCLCRICNIKKAWEDKRLYGP